MVNLPVIQSRARDPEANGLNWFGFASSLTMYLCQASRSPPCFAFDPQVLVPGIKEKPLSSWWPGVTLGSISLPPWILPSGCSNSLVSMTSCFLPSSSLPSFLPSFFPSFLPPPFLLPSLPSFLPSFLLPPFLLFFLPSSIPHSHI